MQTVSALLQAELVKGQFEPRVLVDLMEFYPPDTLPGATGFDPSDASETFASQEITWDGIAYRREFESRGDISRSMGEKTNSASFTFSNISRYAATWAQTTTIEGMIVVVRCVNPDVTDDSLVLFVGRCDKPGDVDKKTFELTARQDFGNINVTLPTAQYVAEDPNGLLPGDPLYEGIRFVASSGTFSTPGTTPSTSFFGKLFGRKKKITITTQWSSLDATPYGDPIKEVFGRCQIEAVAIMFKDTGYWLEGLWSWCKGPISTITNIALKNFQSYGLYDVQTHTGETGGTGDAIVRNGLVPQIGGNITEDFRFPGSGLFSLLAFTGASILQSGLNDEPVVIDEPPVVVGLVRGRKIPLPNTSGGYGAVAWSDNPVHITRFILTDSRFCNINSAFMEDSVNYQTSLHCDEPLLDSSNGDVIVIPSSETGQTGIGIRRYRSSGVINTRRFLYYDLGDASEVPETVDGPYTDFDETDIPDTFAAQPILRKRYTANFPITEEVKATDLVHKTLYPTAKLFNRINKRGKIEIHTEKPSSFTTLRSATVVGATSINVLDVTPWKTGADLLTGRLLIGVGLITSEVRDIASAVYSTSGNSIALDGDATGTVTLTPSGAFLAGGSTTVQASGTLTVGGTPAAGDTITATIDGVAVTYILNADDTTGSAAGILAAYINATALLQPYIKAFWVSSSPTVVTIKCLHGALTLSATTGFPTLLIAHDVGEEIVRIAGSLATNSQDVYSAWPASTLVLDGVTYLPTVLNGHKYEVTTEGTTGATEPTWPTTAGGTVASGTAVFTEIGSTVLAQAGLTRANVLKDTFKWPLGGRQSSVNQIKGNFRSAKDDFALTPFKVNDSVHQAQVKKTYPLEADFSAVDNWHQTFRLAKWLLAKNREGDWFVSCGTGPSGLVYEEGDLVCVSDDSGGLINILVRIEDLRIKANHEVIISQARKYSTNMMSDDVTATVIPIPSTLRRTQTADSIAVFIDNFAIREVDALVPGFYVAVSRDLALPGDWRGWKLYADYGDGYVYLGVSGDIAATMGTADTILGSVSDPTVFDTAQTFTTVFGTDVLTFASEVPPNGSSVRVSNSGGALPAPLAANTTYFIRDKSGVTAKLAATSGGAAINLTDNGTGTHSVKNVLTFTLKFGTPEPAPEPFATVTQADLIANPYKNLFSYGGEYLQTATVVVNGDQSYTVSDFYRGRFGSNTTELVHGASEDVVYLNGAEKFVAIDPLRAGIAYNYKVVTINQDVADADPISFTWIGGTMKGPRMTDSVVTQDASKYWLIYARGHATPAQEPATYEALFGLTADWSDEATNTALTLPLATEGFQSVMFATVGGAWVEESESYHTSANEWKNNVGNFQLLAAGMVGTSIQSIEKSEQRFDFEMSLDYFTAGTFSPPAYNATFGNGFGVALVARATPTTTFPDVADCVISVEWSIPADYNDTYPEGTVREVWRTFDTVILTREGVDPGANWFDDLTGEPEKVNGRHGPEYSFLHYGNEVSAHEFKKEPKHIIKVSLGDAITYPFRLVTWIPNGDESHASVRHAKFGGSLYPSTVLSKADQLAAFGADQTELFLRLRQVSKIAGVKGAPLDLTVP